jgi:hypothetical protein
MGGWYKINLALRLVSAVTVRRRRLLPAVRRREYLQTQLYLTSASRHFFLRFNTTLLISTNQYPHSAGSTLSMITIDIFLLTEWAKEGKDMKEGCRKMI